MSEQLIQKQIQLALGQRRDVCLFRQNTGVAKDQRTGQVVKFGQPGQPDLMGILTVRGLGFWLGIEVKTPTGRQTPVQIAYQHMVEARGGIYILARSAEAAVAGVDDAVARIEGRFP